MNEYSEPIDHDMEKKDQYELAGWLTFVSVLMGVMIGLVNVFTFLAGGLRQIATPIIVVLTFLNAGFSIYAVIWFRRLLNRRYDFHGVDTWITLIITLVVLMSIYSIFMSTTIGFMDVEHLSKREALGMLVPILVPMLVFAVLAGVVGIFYGINLLRFEESLFGLKAPLAYTYIIGSILMLTFVFASLGGLALMAADVFQGLILLRSAKSEHNVDFV